MQQVVEWIGKNLWSIVIIVSIFIQITPIKINPWSALFKWIGKIITGNACSKIDGLIDKVDKIEKDVKTNEKDRIRWEILDFANSCRNNRKHTRDEFQHIVALNDKYKRLLSETNDSNGVFEVEYNYIQDMYAERLEKNDFL
jgi:hypothetical protein